MCVGAQSIVRIALAAVKDAEAILELQKLCYQSEAAINDDYSIPPLTQTLESMREEFDTKVVLKAIEKGRIIGSIRGFVTDDTCYVGRVIVHPEFQNRGFGKQLLGAIEMVFQRARRFELFISARSEKNLALYAKFGYREFKRESLNDRVTLVYMEKVVY
ncbi:MAG TPA: GNAT family N-acetyltransferase [Spirochaetia bacterium]|nr:GNAT family N-acetyltransferase [Spirochaetia bacterium]